MLRRPVEIADITRPFPYLSCDRPNAPFCDREVTTLVKELSHEFDPVVRDGKLRHIFDLMHANPPGILLYELVQIDGLRGIEGFENPNLYVMWDRLGLN